MRKSAKPKGRLVYRVGNVSTPLERIVLSTLRQRLFIADDEGADAADRVFAKSWLQAFAAQYVELLREKLARSKGPTVTDEQISQALTAYATQDAAAAQLGITARAIRKRKAKKRNR